MSDQKSLPAHESIVNLIRNAQIHEVSLVRNFITETAIPDGHDKIIAVAEVSWFTLSCRGDVDSVRKHVLSEKQKAKAKAALKKKAEEEKAAAEAEKDRLLDEAESWLRYLNFHYQRDICERDDVRNFVGKLRAHREKSGRTLPGSEKRPQPPGVS